MYQQHFAYIRKRVDFFVKIMTLAVSYSPAEVSSLKKKQNLQKKAIATNTGFQGPLKGLQEYQGHYFQVPTTPYKPHQATSRTSVRIRHCKIYEVMEKEKTAVGMSGEPYQKYSKTQLRRAKRCTYVILPIPPWHNVSVCDPLSLSLVLCDMCLSGFSWPQ